MNYVWIEILALYWSTKSSTWMLSLLFCANTCQWSGWNLTPFFVLINAKLGIKNLFVLHWYITCQRWALNVINPRRRTWQWHYPGLCAVSLSACWAWPRSEELLPVSADVVLGSAGCYSAAPTADPPYRAVYLIRSHRQEQTQSAVGLQTEASVKTITC